MRLPHSNVAQVYLNLLDKIGMAYYKLVGTPSVLNQRLTAMDE